MLTLAYLFSMAATVLTAIWLMERARSHREHELAELTMQLLKDNRALMETVARDAGKPVIFSKPERVSSTGWFDSKPRLKVSEPIK